MTVRWRTVIPLSSALIVFVMTCKLVTQLPTDSSSEDPTDDGQLDIVVQQRDGRSGQFLRLFPDDDNEIVKRKDHRERKPLNVERREKALLLFDDEENQVASMAVPNADIAPQPGDKRDTQQENIENLKQKQHEELLDEKLVNIRNDEDMTKHDDSKNKNDVDAGQNDVGQNTSSGVDNSSLLENVRAIGAIVQRLKRQSDNNRGVAEVEDGQTSAPVNPHPFRYVINCPQLCADVEHLFLVVYVHTAVDHYKRRTVIRQTWGDVSQYDVDIRVVFVMGVRAGNGTEAQDVQSALVFEAERYEDIVQVSQYFSIS